MEKHDLKKPAYTLHYDCDHFSGVHAKLMDIKDGREKIYTAQVLKNVYTLSNGVYINKNTLLLIHDHFAPAEYVLRKNVFLLGVEDDVAKFVELDPDIDLFNIRKYPIFYMIQTFCTKRMIILPLKDFYDLVDSIDTSDRNVVWLFHTLRCGSTVWSQVFAALPKWKVISEAQCMIYTLLQCRNILNISEFAKTEEFEKIVVATIKMHMFLAPKGHSIFWKTIRFDEHMIPIIRKHFPSHKLLFAYRDCAPCSSSFYKSFGRDPSLMNDVAHTCKELSRDNDDGLHRNAIARSTWLFFTNGYNTEFCLKVFKKCKPYPNGFEFFVLSWVTKLALISEFQKEGINFHLLKYEDLQKDPVSVIQTLFTHLGVSSELIGLARKTMKQDSQAGTSFSQESKKSNRDWLRTPDSDMRCNALLREFNLPSLDSATVL